MHGIVTTYQQVATSATRARAPVARRVRHLRRAPPRGDDRAWGAVDPRGVRRRPPPARPLGHAVPLRHAGHPLRRLRRSTRPSPTTSTATATRSPTAGSSARLLPAHERPDGVGGARRLDPLGDLRRPRSTPRAPSQRLRTALSLEGEWLPTVLRTAHARLTEVRREQPDAGGLVIATDQEHARGIAALLADALRRRRRASSPPTTRRRRPGSPRSPRARDPWLVAVRMVSEGVDIPRLRVGVYATTTTTELFFRQAVGRFVRWTRGVPRQRAWLFIPDDPRLRLHAARVAEQRRHSLRRRETDRPGARRAHATSAIASDEQMSLFAAISAVATDASGFDDLDRRRARRRRRRRPGRLRAHARPAAAARGRR